MPIVDSHAFFGRPPESVRAGTMREVDSVLGSCHISAAILASAQAERGDFRRGNEELGRALAGYHNVFGYVTVHPSYPEESVEELRRRLSQEVWRAVKLPRPIAGPRIASEGLRTILHAARRYGRPLLIDTESDTDVRDVVELANEYQSVKFLVGGMGGSHWETAVRLCAQVLNTTLEIGSLEADQDKLRDAVAAVTPRRIVFGSRFPELHPLFVLGMVKDAAIEEADRQRILFRNAMELFELQPTAETIGARRGEAVA
ncbi:MAG: amidohydrolase family protein [Armatimonadetes bacterium]|nr:amidohydrolase family protein [Armatimonadota bacterium]